MEDLPFAKREPRFRHQQSQWITRGAFDPTIEESKPLNPQTITCREIQTGVNRKPGLKIQGARIIDGRVDQIVRNKQNLFFDSNFPNYSPSRLPKTAPGATRHGYTPYSYNTTWISNPDPNTSIAPNKEEMFKTSYLDDPVNRLDKQEKKAYEESKYGMIRQRNKHIEDYVNDCDNDIVRHRTDTQNRIRKNRADHLAALEIRHKREKVRFFE